LHSHAARPHHVHVEKFLKQERLFFMCSSVRPGRAMVSTDEDGQLGLQDHVLLTAWNRIQTFAGATPRLVRSVGAIVAHSTENERRFHVIGGTRATSSWVAIPGESEISVAN